MVTKRDDDDRRRQGEYRAICLGKVGRQSFAISRKLCFPYLWSSLLRKAVSWVKVQGKLWLYGESYSIMVKVMAWKWKLLLDGEFKMCLLQPDISMYPQFLVLHNAAGNCFIQKESIQELANLALAILTTTQWLRLTGSSELKLEIVQFDPWVKSERDKP